MVPYRGSHTKCDEAGKARPNFDGDDSRKESWAFVAQPPQTPTRATDEKSRGLSEIVLGLTVWEEDQLVLDNAR